MKLTFVFLVVFAVAIPTAFSLKCRYCVGSVCTGPSTCTLGGDTCFTTTYKNTSKVVKGCVTASACNKTMSMCKKTPDYCVSECCTTEGCNNPAGFIQINVAMVTLMAFFASLFYFFSH